jgi:hypothetical protein
MNGTTHTDRPTNLVWLIPAALLVAALIPWPYGYYVFLRLIVAGCAAFLAYWSYQRTDRMNAWAVTMTAVAILFNPLIPVHLNRELWALLDLAGAAVFGAHFYFEGRTAKAA